MEHTERNSKIVITVMAALLIASLAGNLYYWDNNRDLAKEKAIVELQANSLLLGQSRDIAKLNKQIERTKRENESLTGRLTELNQSLNRKYTELGQMDASYNTQLQMLRDSMATQQYHWKKQTNSLTDEKMSYASQNKGLSHQVASLHDKIDGMVPSNALTVDGFRVEAEKRNNKETAKAKKVHTLTISFQVPPQFKLSGTQEVYLSLTDLQGIALITPIRTVNVYTPKEEKLIPIHAVKKVDFSRNRQGIAFTLEATDDIKPGLYRASVYTKENYMGAVEFQFRDSFWFF